MGGSIHIPNSGIRGVPRRQIGPAAPQPRPPDPTLPLPPRPPAPATPARSSMERGDAATPAGQPDQLISSDVPLGTAGPASARDIHVARYHCGGGAYSLRFRSSYEKEKVMTKQVNSKSAAGVDTAAENGDMRELSARDLDVISGGFVPGALATAPKLHQVTGSDGTSYQD